MNSNNSLTAFNATIWAKEMQIKWFKENVAIVLANTEMRDQLTEGTTFTKPYRGTITDQAYSKGVDISIFNDLTATPESGTVDTCRVVPFYVDDLDKIQNRWDAVSVFAKDAQEILNTRLDQAVLSEYSNAAQYISAQDLGGSGTGSIAITQANLPNLFFVAGRKLAHKRVPSVGRFAVIGPRILETMLLYRGGRETTFGDTILDNGKVGNFGAFELYLSENVPFTAVLTYGTGTNNPSNDDTVVIDGVTFTFKTTLGATAGDIQIETNADDTFTNLTNAINNDAASLALGTKWIQLADDDRETFNLGALTAVQSTSVDTVTISGYGDVSVVENAANLVLTSNTQYPLFGMKGATDLCVQKSPSVEFRVAEKRLGRYVYPWMLFGKKTFKQMTKALVYAKTDISAWV